MAGILKISRSKNGGIPLRFGQHVERRERCGGAWYESGRTRGGRGNNVCMSTNLAPGARLGSRRAPNDIGVTRQLIKLETLFSYPPRVRARSRLACGGRLGRSTICHTGICGGGHIENLDREKRRISPTLTACSASETTRGTVVSVKGVKGWRRYRGRQVRNNDGAVR